MNVKTIKKKIVVFTILICFAFLSIFLYQTKCNSTNISKLLPEIQDVYTDKVRYNPNALAKIFVIIDNKGEMFKGTLIVKLRWIEKEISSKEYQLILPKNKKIVKAVEVKLPNIDYRGYMAEICIKNGLKIISKKNTAIDVSSSIDKYPRYGFVTDFTTKNLNKVKGIIDKLAKYHINILQFYDWQYKHHQPIPKYDTNKWYDIAGREVNAEVIRKYIECAHERNILTANYNLINGAYDEYEKDGVKKEWGLFKDPEGKEQDYHELPNNWQTSRLYLFNPANIEWQNYIIKEEKNVFLKFNFDYWHIDTLGDRGILYDIRGNKVYLCNTYSNFLRRARSELKKGILLNCVNSYGLLQTANDVNFIYMELWPSSFPSYYSLKEAINNAKYFSDYKKGIVIAAYMNYFLADSPGEFFNEYSVLLTDAVLFANGAAHIELGDLGMLCKEYFPASSNLKLTKELELKLRNYYDFLVAYQNVLRDDSLDSEIFVQADKIKITNQAEPGKVWVIAKEMKERNIIHLINLTGALSDKWRDDFGEYKQPQKYSNITLKVYIEKEIKKLWLASPDYNDGSILQVKFEKGKDKNGRYIKLNIPVLYIWNMIIME